MFFEYADTGSWTSSTYISNENDFKQIGDIISEVLDNINENEDNQREFISSMKNRVISICKKYPIYTEAY